MFKAVYSYFWGDNSNKLLEEALAASEEIEEEHETNEGTNTDLQDDYSLTRVGNITKKLKDLFIIDDKFEYHSKDFQVDIGTKIVYSIYRDEGKIKVANVNLYEEWSNNDIGVKPCYDRVTVAQVSKRDGRLIYTTPDNIIIDLNQTVTEFIPIEGDWLELEIKTEMNEKVTNLFGKILEVKKIRPLRSKIIEGTIRSFDERTYSGYINKDVYFNRESLTEGFLPQRGDRIIAEIIESTQGDLTWRALKIVLNKSNQHTLKKFQFDDVKLADYDQNVDGITITDDINIESTDFNQGNTFVVEICNENFEEITLVDLKFDSQMPQTSLLNEMIFPVTISKKDSTKLSFVVNAKCIGESKELVIFIFEKFNIGRYINIHLNMSTFSYREMYLKKTNKYNVNKSRNYHDDQNNQTIRGQRLQVVPRFVGMRIGDYRVPDRLWDIFLRYDESDPSYVQLVRDDLLTSYPFLKEPLCFQFYEQFFHILLHISEVDGIINMRNYDQDRACFIVNGEYLMLEIENLAEQRPSLIIGDKIIATNPINPNINFEGFIHKVSSNHVYLKFAQTLHESYRGEDYSIRAVASRSQIRKYHHAIYMTYRKLGRELLFPSHVFRKKPQVNFTYDKYDDNPPAVNGNLINKPRRSHKDIVSIIKKLNSPFKEESEIETKFKLEWYNKSLNYYQKEAVRNILIGEARPLPYVIYGPPGTGKTVTIIESILQILRMLPHSRLLVATPSNSAADLIALRLIDTGCLKPGDLVRFVSYKFAISDSIPLKLVPYCISGNIAKDGTQVEDTIVTKQGLTLGGGCSVIGRHRITIGTCGAIGTLHAMGFNKGHFTHIIVDEAGQSMEPEIMLPLTFLNENEGQIILAGDVKQLGPVITSHFANELGLLESYLERLLNRFPYIRDPQGFTKTGGYDPRLVTFLVYNYRSLPGIINIPNELFYHSELRSTISETDSTEAKFLSNFKEILPIKKSVPNIIFHGVMGENFRSDDSPSWFNPTEASQVFYYVNQLYRLGAKGSDIGIIAPYIKQVKQIKSVIEEAGFEVPKIGTVEEFQGQEFNIIIITTVRSNVSYISSDVKHNIGFISSPKRLNVALTRAKCLNIIIGNPILLMNDSHWFTIIQHCIQNGSYIGCELQLT